MFSSVYISYVIYIKHDIRGQTSVSGDERDVKIEKTQKQTERMREADRGTETPKGRDMKEADML